MERALAIEVRDLWKRYSPPLRFGKLMRALIPSTRAREIRYALTGLDLRVPAGSTVGLVGRNGSGKTTLLRILAGGLCASRGSVAVRGRRAALIELGAGVDLDASGTTNALLIGVLAGATRSEVTAQLDAIREFSGLGHAFDEPARTYSAGMLVRLAFSAAIHTQPDVMLVDEALSVGDAFFQQRCLLRIRQLQEKGCTIVLATHDPSAVLSFCDRAIWLEHGHIHADGVPAHVMRDYMAAHASDPSDLEAELDAGEPRSAEGASDEVTPAEHIPNIDQRRGDARARVEGIAIRSASGAPLGAPLPGELTRVVISARASAPVERPIVGFTLRNRLGEILCATNTSLESRLLPRLAAGDRIHVEFALRWPPFASGTFSFSPAIADGSLDQHAMCDWIDNAIVIEFANPHARYGWFQLENVAVRCGHAPGNAP